MKFKFKKMAISLSLLFLLLISLAIVSAESISVDSNGLSLNDNLNNGQNDEHIAIDNEISDNSQLLPMENSGIDDNSNRLPVGNRDIDDRDIISDSKINDGKKIVAINGTDSKSLNKTTVQKTTVVLKSKKTKKSTFVISSNTIGKMGKKVTLRANVFDLNGKAVKSGTVRFTLKGKSYKVKVKNGFAKKTIVSPFLGIYKVKVKYIGDSTYKASSSSFRLGSDLKVKHKYFKNVEVRKGAKQFYQIKVINQYTKKVLKNFKVKIKVKINAKKWKTYTIKSNSKGIAKLSTKNLALGTHNLRICSAYKYIKTNLKGKITVVKRDYV